MNDRVIWLSANLFGMKVLEHFSRVCPEVVTHIVTLSNDSGTTMYDGVEPDRWKQLSFPVDCVKNPKELEGVVNSLSPTLVVMCGWRQILNNAVCTCSRLGVVGFHPTLLPKGRGPAPIINTILEGLTKSGVTMFHVSSVVDGGDIIGQRPFTISETDDAEALYHKVIEAGRHLAEEFIPKILAGTAPRTPQDESRATHFPQRSLKDNEILPTDSLELTHRKIRAFSWPYKGAFLRSGGKKLIVWKGELVDEK